MSFILDALKKSDQKRKAGTAPRLETLHIGSTPVKGTRSRSRWPLLIILILVLNMALMVWFLGSESPTGLVKKSLRQKIIPATTAQAPQPVAVVTTVPQPKEAASSLAQDLPALPKGPVSKGGGVTPIAPDDPPPALNRTLAIAELPEQIRTRLPALHMSLHAYSSEQPAASLVRVNDRLLRQGALLEGRYRVDEITSEGVLFSYQGYRFLLPR